MILFKNKYKARIEAKINKLETEKQKVISLRKDTKQSINPQKYCSYVLRQAELSNQIKLLKDLLL